MAKKNQLEERIAALEAEVASLRSQVAAAYPYWSVLGTTPPGIPWTTITSGTVVNSAITPNEARKLLDLPEYREDS